MQSNFLLDDVKLNTNINIGVAAGCQWLEGKSLITSYNPATNKAIASASTASIACYEKILTVAVNKAKTWQQHPAPQRAELVRLIAAKISADKDKLGMLISLETGKSLQEGLGEVQEMIDMADFAIGQARMLHGCVIQSERAQHRMYEQWMPLGVVGIITAFNFPMAVWAWNAFIAIICGNTIVWKPSPLTPLTSIAVHKICVEVMTDINQDGVISLLNTDNKILLEKFITDKRFSLISFTGSTEVGRLVATKVASRFGKYILELGGNNASIVDKNADISMAVNAIIFAAIGTAGQRCTSLRRLIVHEDILPEVITRLKKAYSNITIGDPLNSSNLMGPLINKAAVEKYEKIIRQLHTQNVEIVSGGNVVNAIGNYVEPTLVVATAELNMLQDENFLPILFVLPFKTLSEAVRINNNAKHGLSSSIFTTKLLSSEYFLSSQGSDCGIANVNMGPSGAEISGAFGGEKDTGGGREAGSDAWKGYMRRQTVCVNFSGELPLAQGVSFILDKR